MADCTCPCHQPDDRLCMECCDYGAERLEALTAKVELLSSTRASIAADNVQLRAEVEQWRTIADERLQAGVRQVAEVERLTRGRTMALANADMALSQLREHREAYDLLHKRIEAYDETHAYLQELREAAEAVLREWVRESYDQTISDDALDALAAVLAKVTL